jgi:hypothetical protein
MAGLEERDERFYFVLFNIGVMYAQMRDSRRSLDYFRRLLDRHPEQASATSSRLFATREALAAGDRGTTWFRRASSSPRCPELFDATAESSGQ